MTNPNHNARSPDQEGFRLKRNAPSRRRNLELHCGYGVDGAWDRCCRHNVGAGDRRADRICRSTDCAGTLRGACHAEAVQKNGHSGTGGGWVRAAILRAIGVEGQWLQAGCMEPLVVGKSCDWVVPVTYTELSEPNAMACALSLDDPASLVHQRICEPSGESFAAKAWLMLELGTPG